MCTKLFRLSGIRLRQAGISLIELILFIVIISVALVGVLLVMNQTTMHSGDALLRKQSLAIAESLLEEVELMPFTWCDPDDPSAVTATSYAGCTASQQSANSYPATESRGDINYPFDNVVDYSNYTMSTIKDINGATVSGLTGYSAHVAIAPAGTSYLGVADNNAGLQITVTVTAPDGSQLQLDGYRARYAPNGT
jgi:MSHA pilin protein MshD